MIRRILLILLLPLIAYAGIRERVDGLLQVRHPEYKSQFEKFTLTPAIKKEIEKKCSQRFIKDFVYVWALKSPHGSKKVVIVDAVRAKSAFITMMTTIDSTNCIEKLDILDYKGDRGRRVDDSTWLAQFTGKHADSDFEIGKNIDAVTGATYSAAAIAKAAKRWTMLAQQIED